MLLIMGMFDGYPSVILYVSSTYSWDVSRGWRRSYIPIKLI